MEHGWPLARKLMKGKRNDCTCKLSDHRIFIAAVQATILLQIYGHGDEAQPRVHLLTNCRLNALARWSYGSSSTTITAYRTYPLVSMHVPAFATPIALCGAPSHFSTSPSSSINPVKCVIESLNKLSITFNTTPQAEGSFGEVFFGTLTSTNEPVVLKRPRPTSVARNLFRTERVINEKLDTAVPVHWPKFLGIHFRASQPYLVWRKVGEGATLHEYLFERPPTELSRAMSVSLEAGGLNVGAFKAVVGGLLRALDHIHSRAVVHRDVKPANILIAPGYPNPIQVIDFGSSVDISNPFWSRGVNTLDPLFAAPEQRLNLFHPQKFDVFSVALIGIAVLLPSLASQSRLREFRLRLEQADFCLRTYKRDIGGRGDLAPLFADNAAAINVCELLAGMLRRDPAGRISVRNALQKL